MRFNALDLNSLRAHETFPQSMQLVNNYNHIYYFLCNEMFIIVEYLNENYTSRDYKEIYIS